MPRLAFVLQVAALLIAGVALAEHSYVGLVLLAAVLWACVIDLDINGKPSRRKGA